MLVFGATREGIEPDPLDEVVWWQTDDFWWYPLAASVAVLRTCAERRGEPVPTFVARLSKGQGSAPPPGLARTAQIFGAPALVLTIGA